MHRYLHRLLLIGLLLLPAVAGAEEPEAGTPGVPDEALQKRIDAAIDSGATWLRTQQKTNGLIGGIVVHGASHWEIGSTALAGLALLAAGDVRGDEAVDKAYQYCKRKDEMMGQAGNRQTYDVGTLLMFITAYWADKEEDNAGHTRTGRSRGNPCNLPDDVKQWVQDLASWLVRVREAQTSTWGYPMPAGRDDLSNTQYAYLGLRAARDCGAKIPSAVFLRGLETMIERQEQDGPKVQRIIPGAGPGDSPYVIDAGDRARGWPYRPLPNVTATGSMTTAGIGVLAICHDALMRPKEIDSYTSQLRQKAQRAVQDGFSWLDMNFSVTSNPPAGAPAWHYYYLYGLERAAILGGRELIGQHDWYLEGANYLVGAQHPDGRWATGALGAPDMESSDVADTAWAILFLARATRPAPPIPAPVVTGG